jgi:hypothetical protein
MADSVTQILKSGPPGTKLNIAVLGDGFANADQTAYNNNVQAVLLDGVFGMDYFYEDKSAYNIYRVNLISVQSGVSQRVYNENGTPADASDDTIVSTTLRNTALGFIYSGSWAHCWMEWGANTATRVQNALDTWVPDYDLVVVILNEPGFGGCGGGGFQIVTLGSSASVMAHEFGHGTGGLADEYCQPGTYTGGEPGTPNITINTDRATLKWRQFVDPATPVPTGIAPASPTDCTGWTVGTKPAGWSNSDDAGLFEGAQYRRKGIYRPAINCRMRGNSPPFCPVCYTRMKSNAEPHAEHTFLRVYAGDFNGDGKDDILVHSGNAIHIYRSNGSQLDVVFSAVERVPGSWQFQPGDRFYVGDFNGDGKDEVAVFNGTNWVTEYLGLLADDGANGLRLVARYDNSMPNWDFTPGDRFYVADFNGDGKKDLFVFNGGNWSIPYLGMLRSTGTALAMSKRYDANMPGWQMRPGDRHYVGDFTGNGKADLYVFNGINWSIAYLGMLQSTGNALSMVRRYDGNAPGWQMRAHDTHWISDINNDGKADLFVYNHQDWGPEYLGTMITSGTDLVSAWREDWVGEWNLGSVDRFEPCDYEGVGGRRDLIVHNTDWLGMIRATPSLSLQRIYYKWIHNYEFGRNW